MEGTSAGPFLPHSLLLLLHILPSFTLKVLRSHVRDVVSAWVVLVTLVPGEWLTQRPGEPRRWTPAVPEGGLDVIRGGFPDGDIDAAVLVWLFRKDEVAKEIWTWEGEIAQEEFTDRQ